RLLHEARRQVVHELELAGVQRPRDGDSAVDDIRGVHVFDNGLLRRCASQVTIDEAGVGVETQASGQYGPGLHTHGVANRLLDGRRVEPWLLWIQANEVADDERTREHGGVP